MHAALLTFETFQLPIGDYLVGGRAIFVHMAVKCTEYVADLAKR